MHCVLIASDFDDDVGKSPRWKPVTNATLITLQRTREPQTEAL